MGVSTVYDPKHGTLAYDFHPHEPSEFAPLDGWLEVVSGELNRRTSLGLEFEGWATVKRVDVGIDVGFRRPELGRAFYEALRDRRYTKGRRVQERQPGWFSVFGRGTKQPVLHGRVYDKGLETRLRPAWTWIRTERVVRWERRNAMRLSLLTPGAMRYAYDEVFMEGLAPGTLVRKSSLGSRLAALVSTGSLNVRQYEELAGFLLAEAGGLTEVIYAGRPDWISRRAKLAREAGVPRHGARSTADVEIDLHEVMSEIRSRLAA